MAMVVKLSISLKPTLAVTYTFSGEILGCQCYVYLQKPLLVVSYVDLFW